MDEQIMKSAMEALLFVSDKPIVLEQFKAVFPQLGASEIRSLASQLQDEYLERHSGMVIVEIAQGWQMLSDSHVAAYIREFYKTKTKEKLSRPALESLAIIAYKQPVARGDVEMIRGVNSDGTIAHLLNKGLITIVGRKEVPGRPFLYGTTKEFLDYFGLKELQDLPKIEEFQELGVDIPQQAPPQEVLAVEVPAQVQEQFKSQLEQAIDQMQQQAETRESSGQSRIEEDGQNSQESHR
jgi:segregation and condensation protein B